MKRDQFISESINAAIFLAAITGLLLLLTGHCNAYDLPLDVPPPPGTPHAEKYTYDGDATSVLCPCGDACPCGTVAESASEPANKLDVLAIGFLIALGIVLLIASVAIVIAYLPSRMTMRDHFRHHPPIVPIAFLALLLLAGHCNAQTQARNELELTKVLAQKYNATGLTLWDSSRVDLVNDRYAIEVDWAAKWQEAVGQSLYYAIVANREPAIILLTTPDDDRFVYRCQIVCTRMGIRLFVEPISGIPP